MVGEKDWRRCARASCPGRRHGLIQTVDRKDRLTPSTMGKLINSKLNLLSEPQGSFSGSVRLAETLEAVSSWSSHVRDTAGAGIPPSTCGGNSAGRGLEYSLGSSRKPSGCGPSKLAAINRGEYYDKATVVRPLQSPSGTARLESSISVEEEYPQAWTSVAS
jgi:hypothetical protein